MKFLACAAAILPLVSSAAIDLDVSFNSTEINATNIDAHIDALEIIRNLLDTGVIDIVDVHPAQVNGLAKRAKVPGLNCGTARLIRCGLSGASQATTCAWAAASSGTDAKENTKCAAGVVSFGANPVSLVKVVMGCVRDADC